MSILIQLTISARHTKRGFFSRNKPLSESFLNTCSCEQKYNQQAHKCILIYYIFCIFSHFTHIQFKQMNFTSMTILISRRVVNILFWYDIVLTCRLDSHATRIKPHGYHVRRTDDNKQLY